MSTPNDLVVNDDDDAKENLVKYRHNFLKMYDGHIQEKTIHVGATILHNDLQPKINCSKKGSSIVTGIQQHGTRCILISHPGKVELPSRGTMETVQTQCKFRPG